MSLYYGFLDLVDIDFSKDRLAQSNQPSHPKHLEPDTTVNIIQLDKLIAQKETLILGQATRSVSNHTDVEDLLLSFDDVSTAEEAPVTPVLSAQIDFLTEVFGPSPLYDSSNDPLADFLKSHDEVTSIKTYETTREEVRLNNTPSISDVTKKMSSTAFDELLARHGMSPSTSIPQTLESMKISTASTDPFQQKLGQWSKGKETNIRALLCSLHEILWDGSDRWTRPSISELLESSQVKKWYKKACLVVHPDKQVGTDNELLAKSVFTQLNIAWAYQENL